MVYNGDIMAVESGKWKAEKIKGIMLGRGLLARPWMLGDKEPKEVLKTMHSTVYRHAVETLCGDGQILSRLHAFCEFIEMDGKLKKNIKKATDLHCYDEAVAMAFRQMCLI